MSQRHSYNLTLRYGLYQLHYYLSCAGIFGFAATYLLEKGFQTSEAGVIVALSYLLSCIMQPLLGDFVDRFPGIRLPNLIAVYIVCSFLCFAAIQFFHPPLLVVGILYAAGGIALTVTVTLSNALCVDYNERGYAMDYGIGSGVGSLSYSFATLGFGYLIAALGADWMIWLVLISMSVQLVITLGYPKVSDEKMKSLSKPNHTYQPEQNVSIWTFFLKYKYFMVTVAGVIMLAMCHSMAESYLINLFGSMGGNSRNVGTALCIASFSAAPFLLMFEKVQKKINVLLLMRLSGIFFVMKTIMMFFASSVWQVYVSSCLQTFTYGFIYPSLFYFTKMKVQSADMTKGQAIVVAAFVLGSALGSFVGGKTIDACGFKVMILVAGALAGLGAAIINYSIEK